MVATSAAAIPEIVADGVTGLLVPPEEPAALAAGSGGAGPPARSSGRASARPAGGASPSRSGRSAAWPCSPGASASSSPAKPPDAGRLLRPAETAGPSRSLRRPAHGAGLRARCWRASATRSSSCPASAATIAQAIPVRQQRLLGLGRRLAARLVRRVRRAPARPLVHLPPLPQGTRPSRAGGRDTAGHPLHRRRSLARAPPRARALGRGLRRQPPMRWSRRISVLAMTSIDQRRPALGRARKPPDALPALPGHAPLMSRRGVLVTSIALALATAHGLDPDRPWLLTVAMMRPDVKRESYRLLAEALEQSGSSALAPAGRGRWGRQSRDRVLAQASGRPRAPARPGRRARPAAPLCRLRPLRLARRRRGLRHGHAGGAGCRAAGPGRPRGRRRRHRRGWHHGPACATARHRRLRSCPRGAPGPAGTPAPLGATQPAHASRHATPGPRQGSGWRRRSRRARTNHRERACVSA